MEQPPISKFDDITETEHLFRQTAGDHHRIGVYNKKTKTFYKEISVMLHTPPAISLDERVMMWLKYYECEKVIVVFLPTKITYTSSLKNFFAYCERIDRDHDFGPQLYLCLEYWHSSENKQLELF